MLELQDIGSRQASMESLTGVDDGSHLHPGHQYSNRRSPSLRFVAKIFSVLIQVTWIIFSLYSPQTRRITVGTDAKSTTTKPPTSKPRYWFLRHRIECCWNCKRRTWSSRLPTQRPISTRYVAQHPINTHFWLSFGIWIQFKTNITEYINIYEINSVKCFCLSFSFELL